MRNYDKSPVVIKNFDRFFAKNNCFTLIICLCISMSITYKDANDQYIINSAMIVGVIAILFLIPILFYRLNKLNSLIILKENQIEFIEDEKIKRVIMLEDIKEIKLMPKLGSNEIITEVFSQKPIIFIISTLVAMFFFSLLFNNFKELLIVVITTTLLCLISNFITKAVILINTNSTLKDFRFFSTLKFARPIIEETRYTLSNRTYILYSDLYYGIFLYNDLIYKKTKEYFITKKGVDIKTKKSLF